MKRWPRKSQGVHTSYQGNSQYFEKNGGLCRRHQCVVFTKLEQNRAGAYALSGGGREPPRRVPRRAPRRAVPVRTLMTLLSAFRKVPKDEEHQLK